MNQKYIMNLLFKFQTTGEMYDIMGYRTDKPGSLKERISFEQISPIDIDLLCVSASTMTGRVVIGASCYHFRKIYRNLNHAIPVIKDLVEYYTEYDETKCDIETYIALMRTKYNESVVPYLERKLITLFYVCGRVSLCTRTLNIHYGTYPNIEIFSDFDAFENKLNNILDYVNRLGFSNEIDLYNGEIVPLGPETINRLREIYEEKSKPYRELNNSAKSARMRK